MRAAPAQEAAQREHEEPDEAEGADETQLLPALRRRHRAEAVALALRVGEGADAVVDAREDELRDPEAVHLRLRDAARDRLAVLSV